jgi:hypothetical protein
MSLVFFPSGPEFLAEKNHVGVSFTFFFYFLDGLEFPRPEGSVPYLAFLVFGYYFSHLVTSRFLDRSSVLIEYLHLNLGPKDSSIQIAKDRKRNHGISNRQMCPVKDQFDSANVSVKICAESNPRKQVGPKKTTTSRSKL